jgi:hypothetical protein
MNESDTDYLASRSKFNYCDIMRLALRVIIDSRAEALEIVLSLKGGNADQEYILGEKKPQNNCYVHYYLSEIDFFE